MKTPLKHRIKESVAVVVWIAAIVVLNVIDEDFVDRLVAEEKK